MPEVITDADRVSKQTSSLPVASFTLRRPQIVWVAEEAERRQISKSELIRELIDARMAQEAA
jgi:hypothetical protein